MASFLNVLRLLGLVIFAAGVGLSLLTLANFVFGFTEDIWLRIYFIRFYLFLMVSGILLYILITFRRKDDEKE